MAHLRTGMLWVACAWMVAVGCSDDESSGGGGAGAATTTSSTSTTTYTTSSTSSTSTTSTTCDIDITQSMGSSQECNDCVAMYCCVEALAFEANPSRDTYLALDGCASGSNRCYSECRFPACGDDRIAFLIGEQCAACIDQSCCDELFACHEDETCGSCYGTGQFTESPCCANESYLALDACGYGECGTQCAPLYHDRDMCEVGGSGGAGGQGGSGGAGGSG